MFYSFPRSPAPQPTPAPSAHRCHPGASICEQHEFENSCCCCHSQCVGAAGRRRADRVRTTSDSSCVRALFSFHYSLATGAHADARTQTFRMNTRLLFIQFSDGDTFKWVYLQAKSAWWRKNCARVCVCVHFCTVSAASRRKVC